MEIVVRAGAIVPARAPANRDRIRIVLLRADDPQHSYLETRVGQDLALAGVVVEVGALRRAGLRRSRHWSALGWRVYQSTRQRVTGRAAYRRTYFAGAAANRAPGSRAVERAEVDWVNSPTVARFLGHVRPDLLLVCGTSYIRPELLAVAPVAINIHGGFLPHYRGNHGVYFAFEKADFAHVGASLHLVSAELDGGPLIAVARPDIFPHDNDEHLYCRAIEDVVEVLCGIIKRLEAGQPVMIREQPSCGVTYRHRDRTPGRELRLWARRRLGTHRSPRVLREIVTQAESADGGPPAPRVDGR